MLLVGLLFTYTLKYHSGKALQESSAVVRDNGDTQADTTTENTSSELVTLVIKDLVATIGVIVFIVLNIAWLLLLCAYSEGIIDVGVPQYAGILTYTFVIYALLSSLGGQLGA